MADSFWDGLVESIIGDAAAAFEKTKTYGGTSIGDSLGSSIEAERGGKGGYFAVDLQTADKIKQQFENRRRSIEERNEAIMAAEEALGRQFANDPESMGYNNQALRSIKSLRRLNKSMETYTSNYIAKIERAIETYRKDDDAAADTYKAGKAH